MQTSTATFRENVGALLASRRLTRTAAAEAAGLSQPQLSAMLNSAADVRLSTVDKLAAALGVTPAALLTPSKGRADERKKRRQ